MESNKLEQLIERFWRGEATESEEDQLREAVRYGQCPEKHADLKDYFAFLDASKNEEALGEVFDLQVMHEIERRSSMSAGFPWMKLAAGIAILLASFFGLRSMMESGQEIPQEEELVFVDTYDDPEIAYQEVKKALMIMGNGMNEGLSYTGKLGAFDQAKESIKNKDSKGSVPAK